MGLNYETAVSESSADEGEYTVITLDKRKIKVYTPTESDIALMFARTSGRHVDEGQLVGSVIDFFFNLLDKGDAGYLERRLLDRKDPFDVEFIEGILKDLMEVWTANPTDEPSGSI